LVDDDPFIRESLQLILEMHKDIEVAGTCINGEEAVGFIKEHDGVDVVLMDIRMPVCDGVEGTARIKASYPHIAVLILTTFNDDDYLLQALKKGANGYMLKNVPPAQIVDGIRTVHNGHMLIHPDVARKLSALLQMPQQAELPGEQRLQGFGLNETERRVVEQIAEGKTNREIAQVLYLSEGTVKNYITEILAKLSLRDRTQIAIFYWKRK
jgi:DNA-binding NarL/FixJ family response regulator